MEEILALPDFCTRQLALLALSSVPPVGFTQGPPNSKLRDPQTFAPDMARSWMIMMVVMLETTKFQLGERLSKAAAPLTSPC